MQSIILYSHFKTSGMNQPIRIRNLISGHDIFDSKIFDSQILRFTNQAYLSQSSQKTKYTSCENVLIFLNPARLFSTVLTLCLSLFSEFSGRSEHSVTVTLFFRVSV